MSTPSGRRTDHLGPPYTVETIELEPDHEGPLHAQLVHRPADHPATPVGAVLHIHGFNDYFFHTEYAEWWSRRGWEFYALDLRKYGRSLDPHHTPGSITDLADYYAEIDAAWQRITGRDGHRSVVLSAHSTGGLTATLWANERRPQELDGVLLNSPWLDLHGPWWLRTIGKHAIRQIGSRQPTRIVPRTPSTIYSQTLHISKDGEFDYNLAWKSPESMPVSFGWLAAIRNGQATLHTGLDVAAPVLVLCSTKTSAPTEVSPEAHQSDIVLDVEQIRRWSPFLGRHVTCVGIEGAKHDVVLSLPAVRQVVYDEIRRWVSAYVEDSERRISRRSAQHEDDERDRANADDHQAE